MARLQEVLREASARNAYELVMESGQPVVLTTPQGPEALGGVLDEGALIDALTHVLDDEQQVELAVGNLIEFQLETDAGRWTLVTEPVSDGVLVRGRRQDAQGRAAAGPAAPARGGALDLPPLDPFSPPATGEPLPAPGAGVDPRRASRPTAEEAPVDFGGPVAQPTARHGSSPGIDVDVSVDLDAPPTGNTLFAGGAPPPPADPVPPPVDPGANEAPVRLEVSLEGLDFGAPVSSPPPTKEPTLIGAAGGPAPVPSMGPAEQLEPSAAADLGFGAPASAGPQGRHDNTLHMGSDPPRPAAPSPDQSFGIPDDDDDTSFADLNVEVDEEPPTFRPPGSEPIDPIAFEEGAAPMAPPTPTPATGATDEGLVALAGSIEPGTLCFVHGHGVAEQLAEYIVVPYAVIEDGSEGTRAVQDLLDGDTEPGTVVVRVEDPAAQLGFLLRRLEEGWRVLVETRARSAEGARRILLGVGATAAAEAWLDAQVTSWAMREAGTWKLY